MNLVGTGPGGRTCPRTGLRLVPAQGQTVFRVTKMSYGPLNPPQRQGQSVGQWGRWDVNGHRTIYVADGGHCGYLEVLSYFEPSKGLSMSTDEAFTDEGGERPPGSIIELIHADWEAQHGGFTIGKLPQVCRDERRQFELRLPRDGWFVDVEHSDTLQALNASLAQVLLPDYEDPRDAIDSLTRGDLMGVDRRLTTAVAGYIHSVILDDGSLPHGISYGSKHGTDLRCLAIWLRKVDDGHPVHVEPTKHVATRVIELDDADFQTAATKARAAPLLRRRNGPPMPRAYYSDGCHASQTRASPADKSCIYDEQPGSGSWFIVGSSKCTRSQITS